MNIYIIKLLLLLLLLNMIHYTFQCAGCEEMQMQKEKKSYNKRTCYKTTKRRRRYGLICFDWEGGLLSFELHVYKTSIMDRKRPLTVISDAVVFHPLRSQDNVIGDVTFPIWHNDSCEIFQRMKYSYIPDKVFAIFTRADKSYLTYPYPARGVD